MVELPSWILATWSLLLTGAGAAFGWLINRIFRAQDEFRMTMNNFPAVYVRRDDLKAQLDDIKSMLVRMENKLDGKVDKRGRK